MRISTRADDIDKHNLDVNHLVFHKGKLYSAGDDGRIKVWQSDLTKIGEVRAHTTSVFALAAGDDRLYSCSNDGTVKSWDYNTLKPISTVYNNKSDEIWKICFSDGHLFAGDNNGNIFVFRGGKLQGELLIAEPVKDLIVKNNVLFTVNQLDLVITDLKVRGEHIQYATTKAIEGKAPVTLIDDKYIVFASRSGKDIIVHDFSHESHFREITHSKDCHQMIINAMVGVNWDNQNLIFSGGWDKHAKTWKLEGDKLTQKGSVDCEFVVNCTETGEKGYLYCGGSDGHIVRIDI